MVQDLGTLGSIFLSQLYSIVRPLNKLLFCLNIMIKKIFLVCLFLQSIFPLCTEPVSGSCESKCRLSEDKTKCDEKVPACAAPTTETGTGTKMCAPGSGCILREDKCFYQLPEDKGGDCVFIESKEGCELNKQCMFDGTKCVFNDCHSLKVDECKSSDKLCSFKQNFCTEFQKGSPIAGQCSELSKGSCIHNTQEACTLTEEEKCSKLEKLEDCLKAANEFACHLESEETQCYWNATNTDQRCLQYHPSTCEGDNGKTTFKNTCFRASLNCKWLDGKCQNMTLTDGCIDIINQYGCENLNKSCKFDNKCSPWELVGDETCDDGRNKFQCKRSTIECAWGTRCMKFDNYTHNCDDSLSFKSCTQVPFPCGWSGADFQCSWFDDSRHQCAGASNEVACLIAYQGCKWVIDEQDKYKSRCVIDDSMKNDDSFWKAWNDTEFNDDFIKKFFEEKAKTEKELQDSQANKQGGGNASNPNQVVAGNSYLIAIPIALILYQL